MTDQTRVGLVAALLVVLLAGCGGSTPVGSTPVGGTVGTGPSASSTGNNRSTGTESPGSPGAGAPAARDPGPGGPSGSVGPSTPRSAVPDPVAAPPTAAPVTGLQESTTFTTVRGTSVLDGPVSLDGVVLHPRTAVAVFAAPGGRAVAALPATQLGSPTWVPVLREIGGWSEVLLPSRPNGSTGWVVSGDHSGYDLARSDAVVRVRLRDARMTIERDGREVGSWPVVIGAPATPTPAGTTFVMASVDDPGNAYSRYLLPLGWHSATLDSFGGGPGTVAVHGWRDSSVFARRDRELSHGCVRVPVAALSVARSLPLGTPVVIS